jgi:hypothetical protein
LPPICSGNGFYRLHIGIAALPQEPSCGFREQALVIFCNFLSVFLGSTAQSQASQQIPAM